ncbi:MAG: tetratricopeptide repeat protein [Clostridia bacterium]|nr:tetratricopeptide repeat protein [Clostridia bacterium]
MGRTRKIDFSAKRLNAMAEKFYDEGNYLSALRFTFRDIEENGENFTALTRLCDVYENLGLNSTAIKYLFKLLDVSDEADYPDIYEGLAVNYLNMGKEAPSAFYYNSLIDADDGISNEMKLEIAQAFAKKAKSPFKISYPPHLAEYNEELDEAARALKHGDCNKANRALEKVEKGSKQYESAREMLSLSYVLSGKIEEAKAVCEEVLQNNPDNVRIKATLAAAYLESKEYEKSKEIAVSLSRLQTDNEEELYKIATVCCENGLHKEAYERFVVLERKAPFDGKLLYFKGVSAYKSGLYEEAISAFSDLCTVYPEAAVVEYFLQEMRKERESSEQGEPQGLIDINYFYQIPQTERDSRLDFLMSIEKTSKEDAVLLGAIANATGLLRWCFDEHDGMDYDLQYVACLVANRSRQDEFLREVLLDNEVIDILKLEILKFFYERNEHRELGLVLYDVYRKVEILPIKIGRKQRKKFISAYARTASKFVLANNEYGELLRSSAETLYRALETFDCLDHVDNVDECACAIYLLSDLKEWGNNIEKMAAAFDANVDRVKVLLTTVACYRQSDRDLDLLF